MERCVEVRRSKNINVKTNKKMRVFTCPRGAPVLEDDDCFWSFQFIMKLPQINFTRSFKSNLLRWRIYANSLILRYSRLTVGLLGMLLTFFGMPWEKNAIRWKVFFLISSTSSQRMKAVNWKKEQEIKHSTPYIRSKSDVYFFHCAKLIFFSV